jgi:hypothetical protein
MPFGHREARHAIYKLAAVLAVVGLIALDQWGLWLAWSCFGFSTIGSGITTTVCIGVLGFTALALAHVLIAICSQVPARSV